MECRLSPIFWPDFVFSVDERGLLVMVDTGDGLKTILVVAILVVVDTGRTWLER